MLTDSPTTCAYDNLVILDEGLGTVPYVGPILLQSSKQLQACYGLHYAYSTKILDQYSLMVIFRTPFTYQLALPSHKAAKK